MDLSHTQSFYVTLSSDEGVARFPKNRDSDFSVQLGPEMVLTPSDWEVGLATFTYRYDFNTVGYDNLIHVRYRDYSHEIKIPIWNCQTVEELAAYLDVEMNKKILHGKRPKAVKIRPVEVMVDAFKRVRFSFDTDDIDMGFAANTAALLGFADQTFFSQENFQKRRRLREVIKATQRDGEQFQTEELEALLKKTEIDPAHVYSLKFLPEFLNTFKNQNENYPTPSVVMHAKLQLFRWLAASVGGSTPFRKAIKAESQALVLNAGKRPTFNFAIVTPDLERNMETQSRADNLAESNVETIQNMFQAGEFVQYSHLDWLKLYPYHQVFDFKELETFVNKFEESLEPEERTQFKSDEHLVTYSGLYTEAITSFIALKFLQSYKHTSPVLYSNEQVSLIPIEQMYIYLDIIKPEPVNNLMSPLLEIIRTEGKSGMLTQYRAGGHLQYKSVEKSNITNLRVLIASKDGGRIPFLRGPTELQLHFRRKSKRFIN